MVFGPSLRCAALIAAVVFGPSLPSTLPELKPASFRACCTWLTCELSFEDALVCEDVLAWVADCDLRLGSDGWVALDDDGLAAANAPALDNANAAMTRLRSFMWNSFRLICTRKRRATLEALVREKRPPCTAN